MPKSILGNTSGRICRARRLTFLLFFIMCLGAAPLVSKDIEKAQSADAFVDSVGVNVHLHYTDTSYGNFSGVKKALTDLGIRHIRDAMIDTTWTPYYDRLNELGRLGMKSTLITSPNESEQLLTSYPRRVHDSLEAYEAPNEYDQSHGSDPDWAATLNAFAAKLHGAVKNNPETTQFPIIGPSLTQQSSFPKIAGSAAFFDYANLHNYFGGWNPGTLGWGGGGYGSIDWNLNLAKNAWPGIPVVTTETGYRNDPSNSQGLPEDVSGRYLPRLPLEQWMHGIKRTYLYELADLSAHDGGSFGLLHSDFSPKPGYSALQNLLHLLSDPGPPFTPGELSFKLSGDLNNVQHLLLQKRNRTFYLALWVEKPSYDVNAQKLLPVPAEKVEIQTNAGQGPIIIHRLDADGQMQSSPIGTPQVFDLDDRVLILQIGP
jgi:hypothetical protein